MNVLIPLNGTDQTEARAALGVDASLTGRRWMWRPGADSPDLMRLGAAIAQRAGLPEIVGRLLALRGLSLDNAADFLDPKLRALMPNPSILHDMDVAAARMAKAVQQAETIGIFGDYDVDGACASGILASFFEELGCAVHTHIPDRMTEGYGPNVSALEGLVTQGASLLICVDCGTAAADILNQMAGKADLPFS